MPSQSGRSLLVLLDNSQVRLQFDPVDVSDNPPSVAFDVTLHWNMPFQQVTLLDRERWFEDEYLRRFESEIVAFSNRQADAACLVNMSNAPMLQIERNGSTAIIQVHAADSATLGTFTFTIKADANAIGQICASLRGYAKWW
jgi:hypothetical protein